MSNPLRRAVRFGSLAALLAYVALLCGLSLAPVDTPGLQAVRFLPWQDLGAHMLAYGGLTLLLCCTLASWQVCGPVLMSAGAAVVLNLGLEWAQGMTSTRHPAAADFVAGLLGTALVAGTWLAARRLLKSDHEGDKETGGCLRRIAAEADE